ncbi:hypothetical protein K438DRAFT_1783959 [Mycena galopus ATCC 62051]|nr:hypothetical protein K438DRAFT_1783959 [Mycena galopus ATCC 62051]
MEGGQGGARGPGGVHASGDGGSGGAGEGAKVYITAQNVTNMHPSPAVVQASQLYGESGIDILYRSVSVEALHDSTERFPEPACHPGTRAGVLNQLKTWSLDASPDSRLLWFNGSAGVGKSEITQMRGHPTRGTWNHLITTISYQLATSMSELLRPIQQAVEGDKLIVGRAMSVQFQQLLVEPFKNVSTPQILPIIIVDGLDECKDHQIQRQILRLYLAYASPGLTCLIRII